MYQVKRPSRSEFVPIRNLTYHVRHWGQPRTDRPTLFMVHGWMDVCDSFQFMVDALSEDWHIIAPDWRGYGQTPAGNVDNFWFPDYLADLDMLIDHYQPEGAIDLLGHSMGGNIAMLYAGVRPSRVRRLVNLEGFGMAATRAAQAPERYAKWMDQLKALHRGEMQLKAYPDMEAVAQRLMKTNPRLGTDKAHWLAQRWAAPNAHGQWEILGDPAHKIINAVLYRVDEVLEIYQHITAPTLCVQASDDSLSAWWKGSYTLAEYHERIRHIPNVQVGEIADAGHMLHHDQPEALARMVEDFLRPLS